MKLLSTFNFKGVILPIIDKNDKMYVFVKNDNDHKILLNIIGFGINTFNYINSGSTKLIPCGLYDKTDCLKIFYMGHELFDFSLSEIDKSSLLSFSNYIIKNNCDIDRVFVSPSFLNGCKIITSSNKPTPVYIKIVNSDTNEIVCEDTFISGNSYNLDRKYYINYEITILNSNGTKIYNYKLDLKTKRVLIKFRSKSLGDTLAWIPYVEEFRKKHECEILCMTHWNSLFINKYPNIKFISPVIVINTDLFAVYNIQCSIPPNISESPVDYRDVSLQEIASKCLGLNHTEIKPIVETNDHDPVITGKYVVIATMSTSKSKLWNNETGWQETIDYLVSKGLKVVLLQKEQSDCFKNVVNMSGNDDILKAINIIKHCEFLVGLSSGLSWLAWALDKKVVVISGFTNPKLEFKNEYRVINTSVCHGCWHDKNHTFDRENWFWCPKGKNFECSTGIETKMVINKIDEILSLKDM